MIEKSQFSNRLSFFSDPVLADTTQPWKSLAREGDHENCGGCAPHTLGIARICGTLQKP